MADSDFIESCLCCSLFDECLARGERNKCAAAIIGIRQGWLCGR